MRAPYIIKISPDGYYGDRPWTSVSKAEATRFSSMEEARKTLNRLQGRLMKDVRGDIFI